jgi:ubiquinone/menaquinone biosynthesis C-methylase UbiE
MLNALQTGLLRTYLRLYGWATHRLYDELAWAYDPISSLVSAGRWDRWRRMALDYVAGPRVLEVGFGTGELLCTLKRQGYDVYGAEFSPAMLRVAASKLRRRGLNIPRARARVQALPFASGAFDTVISTFPAEYIVDPAGLKELGRVLRGPAGRVVIAGLSINLRPSLRYPISLLPSSWEQFYAHFEQRTAAAGLSAHLTWRDDPPARLPVVILEPRDDACARIGYQGS